MPEVFSMEAAVRPVRASRSALVTIWDGRWWPKARRKGMGDSSVEGNPTAHERLCLLEEFGCSEQNTGFFAALRMTTEQTTAKARATTTTTADPPPSAKDD